MNEQRFKKERAKTQVKRIKSFYIHLYIFLAVMIIIGIFYALGYTVCLFCFDGSVSINFVGFLPWLIILCIQGLIVFGKIPFLKRWEAKRIKQFMDEDA